MKGDEETEVFITSIITTFNEKQFEILQGFFDKFHNRQYNYTRIKIKRT